MVKTYSKKNIITFKQAFEIFYKFNIQKKISLDNFLLNQCYLGNSLIDLEKIFDESIDCIITDPPFGIDFGKAKKENYNRNGDNVIDNYSEVNPENYYEFNKKWLEIAYRKLKPNGTLIFISGWSNQRDVLNALYDTKFLFKRQMIWKHNFGLFTKKNLVSSHYNIFFCTKHKSKFKFNKVLWYLEDTFEYSEQNEFNPEIFSIQKEYWRNKIKTSTKLPKELVEMLIAIFTNNGDIILDPFSGSGTILKVSEYMGRYCIAFEISQESVNLSNHRLKNLDY